MAKRHAKMAGAALGVFTWAHWRKICKEQVGLCWWCAKKRKLTIDHVNPISNGGIHDAANVVGACKPCNSAKGDNYWPLESGKLYPKLGRYPLDPPIFTRKAKALTAVYSR